MASRLILAVALLAVASVPSRGDAARARACGRFDQYWTTFRSAALAGRMTEVVALTHFPVELRGTLDSSPPTSVTRARFTDVFGRLLAADSGVGKSQRNYLYGARTVPTRTYNSRSAPKTARVGNLEFRLVACQWRLTGGYLDDA